MIVQELGIEWQVIEKSCLAVLGDIEREEIVALMATRDFSYGRLCEQAIRHKLHCVVAHVLSTEPVAHHVPFDWQQFLCLSLAANKQRNQLLVAEAVRFANAMHHAGVRIAARKGILLESAVYGGHGMRWMNDVDFMCRLEDREALARVLNELGYQAGEYHYPSREIKPHGREYLLTYGLFPDHLPRYTRRLSSDLVTNVAIDIATSFTWPNSGIDVNVDAALATRSTSRDSALPALAPAYHLLDIVLHAFREAYFESTIFAGRDVVMSGFLDVAMVYQAHRDSFDNGAFGRFARERGAEGPVAWVLTHLDRALGLRLSESAGLTGAASEEFLQSWRQLGGAEGTWTGSMRERLASRDRVPLFNR